MIPPFLWWPIWFVATILAGVPLAHAIVTESADVWQHVDIWAPAVNTALLIWLARVQLRSARNVKQTKQIAKDAHKELVEAVKETKETE